MHKEKHDNRKYVFRDGLECRDLQHAQGPRFHAQHWQLLKERKEIKTRTSLCSWLLTQSFKCPWNLKSFMCSQDDP